METHDIYRSALDTFGIQNQIIKLVEETGEFFEAFGKCLGGRDKVAHVAEEMADVHNMLDQFAVYFDCEAEVERQRRYKLRRLEQRIEEEKQGVTSYVMIWDKPNAPRKIRLLQRWCNNRKIFKTIPNFYDYDQKRG